MNKDTKDKTICYYITSHGLGHATRSIEIIRILLKRNYIVHIITAIPAEFFLLSLKCDTERICVFNRLLDGGVVQNGPIYIHPLQTLLNHHKKMHAHRERLINVEVNHLLQHNYSAMLIDATPLACAAGRLANIPLIALVANFSWVCKNCHMSHKHVVIATLLHCLLKSLLY